MALKDFTDYIATLEDTIAFGLPDPDVLPSLRYEDGDVLVKLGTSSKDYLILHSEVLATAPYLAALTRKHAWARWVEPEEVIHPSTGRRVNIVTSSLKDVDGTYILSEDREVSILPEDNSSGHCRHFYDSVLCEGWPRIANCDDDCELTWGFCEIHYAAKAHRVLFALLYGYPLSSLALKGLKRYHQDCNSCVDSDFLFCSMKEHGTMISMIGAYAEYYGCLPQLRGDLIDLLMDHPCLWQAVAQDPLSYARLATKLQSADLYFDALRHLIAQAPSKRHGYSSLGSSVGLGEDDAKAWADSLLRSTDPDVAGLIQELLRIQLPKMQPHGAISGKQLSTGIESVLCFSSASQNETMAQHRNGMLARMIFGQWLAYRIAGFDVIQEDDYHDRGTAPAGSIQSAIQHLEIAATVPKRGSLPLLGDHTILLYAEEFGQGDQATKGHIRQALEDTIVEAYDVIQNHFLRRTEWRNGVLLTWSKTKGILRDETIPYLPLDESQVPWKGMYPSEVQSDASKVSLVDASKEWLEAVGLTEE